MKDTVIINGVEYVPKVEPAKLSSYKPAPGYFLVVDWGRELYKDLWHGSNAVSEAFNQNYNLQTKALAKYDRNLLLEELQDYADQKNAEKQMTDFYYFLVKYDSGWNFRRGSGIIPGTVQFRESKDVDAAIAHFRDRLDLLL